MRKLDRNRGEPHQNSWLDWMWRLLRGGLLSAVVVTVFLLVGAACISSGILGQNQMKTIVLADCVFASLVGGIFAIGTQGRKALPMGLGVGIFLFLLCMIAGMLGYRNDSLNNGGVGILCACLCGGAMAGILCRKSKRKSKR